MSYKNGILIFMILCALFVKLNGEFSDCGSKMGKVDSISVTNCDADDDKCILRRNSNVTIQIQFTPQKDIKELKAIVHGVIMNAPIPFPLPNGNGCVDSGVTCPLTSGTSYNYFTTLPVLKEYPPVSVDVKFELKDENDEDITCSMIPSKIK
nr:ecdysteroid-regulated 16 kDa protein [Onthophagus taurus]